MYVHARYICTVFYIVSVDALLYGFEYIGVLVAAGHISKQRVQQKILKSEEM